MYQESLKFFYYVFATHFFLLLIDYFFKWRAITGYVVCLRKFGIGIRPLVITWYTSIFNRTIQKIGNWRPKFQLMWFSCGTWITLFALPFALYFVIQSTLVLLINVILRGDKSLKTVAPYLEPAVPGVNIPVSDIGYYTSTLLICSIFHELGHATAAVREGIHISGVGVFILCLVPIAYVRIEGLDTLSSRKQLRVFCAGIWHNIVLALIAFFLVFFLPFFSFPFYEYSSGIQVISIHKNSPLLEKGGLNIDDVILSVNHCHTENQNSWIKCLYQAAKEPLPGYCVSSDFINENDETVAVKQINNIVECCNDSVSKLCFEYLEKINAPLEVPQYSCLKARKVIEHASSVCYTPEDCVSSHCFRPSLANGTKLIEIQRRSQNEVLFLGHPLEVLHGVHVSEYIKSSFLPTSIPNAIIKFCNFIIVFSGAFATLNLVPCFHFDGQHIIRVLVDITLNNNVRYESVRLAISLAITIVGSGILVVYAVLILLKYIS